MHRRDFVKTVAITSLVASASRNVASAATPKQRNLPPHWGKPHAPPHWGHPYPIGPDSKPQPGVPRGKVFHFDIHNPDYYPGMQCRIHVYIPAQYKADKPACLAYFFDGLIWDAPTVFDNLIHKKEMPVAIGIGMSPGQTLSAKHGPNPRFARSFEFDSVTDVMSDFIIHQILPEVESRKTPGGLPIIISKNPNDRSIGGTSTGGIGAFNVAWRRPDAFRRVWVVSGSFVGMRGGDEFPVLIRKTEPKPLKVIINDGTDDEWWGGAEFGNWWLNNKRVEDALSFAGYDVNHIWGVGGHTEQGPAVLPDLLRWLWKDWPKPVETRLPGNFNIQVIMKVGQHWQSAIDRKPAQSQKAFRFRGYTSPPVVDSDSTTGAIVSDHKGRVFFMNPSTGQISRLHDNGRTEPFVKVSPGNNGLAYGPDERIYVAETAERRVAAYTHDGQEDVIAEGITCRGLTVTHDKKVYVTESEDNQANSGKVWLLHPGGKKQVVAAGLNRPSGIALTPDGLWMFVADYRGHHAWSYQVQLDGTLQYGEPYYWAHMPDMANDSSMGQVRMDREGRAYAATRMGIQVFDRNGRVIAILPVLPSAKSEQLAGLCFGGPKLNMLYVTTGTHIYRRQVSAVGAPNWAPPFRLPPWGAA